MLAAAGLAGYALVNGGGAILHMDRTEGGVMLRVMLVAVQDVTSSEWGGAITVAVISPTNVARSLSVVAGGSATGFQYADRLDGVPGGVRRLSSITGYSAGTAAASIGYASVVSVI